MRADSSAGAREKFAEIQEQLDSKVCTGDKVGDGECDEECNFPEHDYDSYVEWNYETDEYDVISDCAQA